MKIHKYLHTLTEVAHAIDAGSVVEQRWKRGAEGNIYHWSEMKRTTRVDIFDYEYRTVEETELPEQGDEIMVWQAHENEKDAVKRIFVAFWKTQVLVGYSGDSEVVPYFKHWKPIDKKPVPREWYIRESAQYMNACVKRKGEVTVGADFIHVIEVLEDE